MMMTGHEGMWHGMGHDVTWHDMTDGMTDGRADGKADGRADGRGLMQMHEKREEIGDMRHEREKARAVAKKEERGERREET